MGFDLAQQKRKSRQAQHRRLAVSAMYEDPDTLETFPVTVRVHNKLARAGALEGGFDVEIIEGIDRLVFNLTQLATARNGDALELSETGRVTIPQYNASYTLESQEPDDGPENRYWSVSLVRDA